MPASHTMTMMAEVADPDPLRRTLRTRVDGRVFLLRIEGDMVEVSSEQDSVVGRILGAPRGGSVWLFDKCIAEYSFDQLVGYSLTPIERGLRVQQQTKGVHPIDYLLGAAVGT